MADKFVLSRLASDNDYTVWEKPNTKGGVPSRKKQTTVTVKGGGGVIGSNLVTPKGVVTKVTDAQAKLLEGDDMFKRHKEGGFVEIVASDPKDADKAAANLNKDKSSQLTVDDLKK